MSLSQKVGTFSASTGGATTSVTLGFQPKAIMFWGVNVTADANSSPTGTVSTGGMFYGFSDGTNHRASASAYDTGVATTNAGKVYSATKCIIVLSNGTPTTANDATVAFTGTGFTVTFNATPTSAWRINYFAVGGSDITNVIVGDDVMPTSTGAKTVTYGSAFQADVVLMHSALMTAAGSSASGAESSLVFGAATGSSNRFSMAMGSDDAATMSSTTHSTSMFRDNACLTGITLGSTTEDIVADFTSFSGTGFSLNFTNAATGAYKFAYMAIKGGVWTAGAFSVVGGSGFTTTVSGVTPSAPQTLILAGTTTGNADVVSTSVAEHQFGAYDGTSYAAAGQHSNAVINTTSSLYQSTAFILCEDASFGSTFTVTSLDASGFTLTDSNQNTATALGFIALSGGTGNTYSQTLTETFTVLDTYNTASKKVFSDSLTISDIFGRSLVASRTFAESTTLTDILSKAPAKALADSTTVSDLALSKAPTKSLNDSFVVSDLSLVKLTAKVLLETISMVDAFARSLRASRAFTETVTFTDSLIKAAVKRLSDSVTFSDVVSAVRTILRVTTLSETFTVTDSLARTTSKQFNEGLTLTDTLRKSTAKSLTETVNITDIFSRVFVAIRTFVENVTVSDSLSRKVFKTMPETVTVTDTVNKSYDKKFSETITVTDSLSKSTSKVLSDSVVISDAFSRVLQAFRTCVETVMVTDTVFKNVSKSLSESFVVTDTVAKSVAKVLNEFLTVNDLSVLTHLSTLQLVALVAEFISVVQEMAAEGLESDTELTSDSIASSLVLTIDGITVPQEVTAALVSVVQQITSDGIVTDAAVAADIVSGEV